MDRRTYLRSLGALTAGVGAASATGSVVGTDSATSPSFSVDVDAPDAASVGETVHLEVVATNEGSITATGHLTVSVDGRQVRSARFEARPYESHEATVRVPADEPGSISYEAGTQHDSESGSVEVRPPPDESNETAADASATNASADGRSDERTALPSHAEEAGAVALAVGLLGILGRRIVGRQ